METPEVKLKKVPKTAEQYHKELAEMEAINRYSAPEEAKEVAKDEASPTPLVENLMELEPAIRYAQHAGTHVEVSEKIFNLVSKSSKPYYTAGKPGVKVIKEGFVGRVHDLENMHCEDHHAAITKDKHLWTRK